MNKTIHVAVIGDSVLVDGVAVGLEDDPQITVLQLPDDKGPLLPRLTDFCPEVVIFPLGRPDLEGFLSQLRSATGVRLVGLDVDCDQALVIDSKLHLSLSMASLQNLINEPSNT